MAKVSFKNTIEMEFAKIFDDLTLLNFNYTVLKLITSFPWDALRLRESNNNFLTFCVRNAFDYSVIIIRRIYYDTQKNAVTIPHLHSKIVNDPARRKARGLKDRERMREIKKALRLHEEPVNHFRNRVLAHYFNDPSFKLDKVLRLSMPELRDIIDLMNEYLRTLRSLYDKGGYYRFTPFAGKIGPMDIKKILDDIAKESEVLTYKEKSPEKWDAHIRYLKKEKKLESDLEIINKYRVRLLNLEPIILD